MTKPNTPEYRVCEWLEAAQRRFKNMADAGIDLEGWPNIQQAIKHLEKTGTLTVGQVQYIWSRSNPNGELPKYNEHRNYHLKYGRLTPINLRDLITSELVDWTSGRNGMRPSLAAAISKETDYKWQGTKLVKKPKELVQGLFV